MTLSTVRAAVVATLEGVAGVGVVHDYERYGARLEELKALYVTGGQLRGWYVRRTAGRESGPGKGRYALVDDWLLRGFMALDDSAATEKTFDGLIEAIRDAFRADETLGGAVAGTNVDGRAGVQVTESIPVLFGGTLCHAARLSLSTRRYL